LLHACIMYTSKFLLLSLRLFLSASFSFRLFFRVDKHKQTNRNSDANAWGNFRNAFLYAFPVYVMSLCVRGEIFGLETQHTFTFPFPWPKGNKTKNNKGESRRRPRTRRSSSIKPNLKHTHQYTYTYVRRKRTKQKQDKEEEEEAKGVGG